MGEVEILEARINAGAIWPRSPDSESTETWWSFQPVCPSDVASRDEGRARLSAPADHGILNAGIALFDESSAGVGAVGRHVLITHHRTRNHYVRLRPSR